MSDLFVEHEDVLQERDALTLKGSTDQEQIDKAMEAVNKIDMFSEENDEHYSLVAFLHIALTDAQKQLNERERKQGMPDTKEKEEQPKEAYVPNKNDVILKNNELKNKELLEVFMKDAGEKGENSKSAIRVVKDEGEKGTLIYDLESNYDKTAGQSWILVFTDLSYYSPSENEVQDVFTNASQQCSYMSKET
ncbi:hypothetical protein [Virgibacillus dokdonensis]|uniref:hypothetical protein n=1 Tax=Virgibacillus dokdonensis TaxID=302167 RepID=UPI0011C048D4|nr:hypothetical protein [Virgibacillus dokdonensis]